MVEVARYFYLIFTTLGFTSAAVHSRTSVTMLFDANGHRPMVYLFCIDLDLEKSPGFQIDGPTDREMEKQNVKLYLRPFNGENRR